MSTVSKNFTLKTYTNNTWTSVTDRPVGLHTVVIANTTAGAINVSLRISDVEIVILPTTSIAANTSFVFDFNGLTIMSGQFLQMQASATGIHLTASEKF